MYSTKACACIGLTSSVGAYERNKLWISDVRSHSFWFSRFSRGAHKRVGDLKRQERALSIGVVRAIQKHLAEQWKQLGDPKQSLSKARALAEMGVWFIVGFCVGLRGEEMSLIEHAGTKASLRFQTAEEPHFYLMISGRTKGNQLSGTKFRQMLRGGDDIPEWFAFKSVVKVLRENI